MTVLMWYLIITFPGPVQREPEPFQEGAELPHPLLQQARENIRGIYRSLSLISFLHHPITIIFLGKKVSFLYFVFIGVNNILYILPRILIILPLPLFWRFFFSFYLFFFHFPLFPLFPKFSFLLFIHRIFFPIHYLFYLAECLPLDFISIFFLLCLCVLYSFVPNVNEVLSNLHISP